MFGPRPALQLHQFADQFSVFWPLEPARLEIGAFLDTFASVLAAAGNVVTPISYVRAEAVVPSAKPDQELVTQGQPVVGDVNQSRGTIQSLVANYWTERASRSS